MRSIAPPRWRELLLAALLLALFVAALFARLLFTNRVLASGDILLYFYPYRDYAAAALRAGRIPLWNPYIFGGAPFLANTQAAVLYPLHWPLSWLTVTQQIAWSAALHAWLLGFGGFLLLRRGGGGMAASLVCALVLTGSGFFGGLIGHINQMNGAAWLPWAVLAITGAPVRRVLFDGAMLALLVALMLLAGHTQTTYINLTGATLWALWLAVAPAVAPVVAPDRAGWRPAWAAIDWRPPAVLLLGCTLAALLAAPQLLPTLELTRLGIRSGGLPYLDATSFSLPPQHLLWTLLPTYGLADPEALFGTPAFSEFVAYLGLAALLLAALGAWKGRGPARACGLLLAATGFLLALGRWNPAYFLLHAAVPGFDLFRTPARWMMLYTLGGALLAGLGAQWLLARTRMPRAAAAALVAIVAVELLLAAQAQPHAHPTAPDAVYSLRTAPAHLVTDPARAALHPAAAGRFLGMSTITYDPGDLADYRRILLESQPPQLDPATFDDFVIALKVQELLVPNLSLFWRVPAVDGYDGGILPLARYNLLASLLVPPGQLVADGRLREQIREVPDTGLLGMLNVRYVVTDKVRDLWFENLFYDRQIGARLDAEASMVEIESPAAFEATHIDLIATVDGALPAQGALPVAQVETSGGRGEQFTLTAGGAPGALLADAALDSPLAASSGATVAFRDTEAERQEYRVRLALSSPADVHKVIVRLTDPNVELTIQASTLLDERTGMFQPLLPSDRGRFRLTHSGDVKIYENLDVRPRAYLVSRTVAAATPEAAAALLAAGIPLSTTAVVEGGAELDAQPSAGDGVTMISYAPERVELRTHSAGDAMLVLSDAYYPGWAAAIDGVPAEILPANVLFRGVRVPPGDHTVVFRFEPRSWRQGLLVGAAGFVLWAALLAVALRGIRRASAAVV